MHVLLVGAGNMAIEYAKVLGSLKVDFSVVGRGIESANLFEKETGKKVIIGGLENIDKSLINQFTHAIVATTLESLEDNSLYLLEKGIKHILIEKPGSVHFEGLEEIADLSDDKGSKSYIAYNRRFYSSVMEAEKLIDLDGGLKSFVFDFSELGYKIKDLNKTDFQLNNWFIANSTHVLDMAFYFGGKPKEISSYVSGNSNWHPNGVIYSGAGITDKNILFSYHANWEAPGSWKLELLTSKNRYIFRPLEKLKVQKLGSFDNEYIELDDNLDVQFKPGIYKQVSAFLFNTSNHFRLLNVRDALDTMGIYLKIKRD